jgi:hypothetical protein
MIIAAVGCAATIVVGSPSPDSSLVGTWRSDEGDVVEEYAFRDDHKFISWLQAKGAVLHTPGVIIETGVWKRDGNQLIITPKKTNSSKPSRQLRLLILQLTADNLTAKRLGKKETAATLRRLDLPSCPSASEGTLDVAALEQHLCGTWQMHLNTHDYEMTFHPDHTFSASAVIEGQSVDVPSGVWRLENNKLTIDLEKQRGDSKQRAWKWTVLGFENACVAVTDGSMHLAWRRLK